MENRTIIAELLGLSAWFILVLIFTMAYPEGKIIINMNHYGEYIFELIMYCVGLPIILVIVILDMLKYGREKE